MWKGEWAVPPAFEKFWTIELTTDLSSLDLFKLHGSLRFCCNFFPLSYWKCFDVERDRLEFLLLRMHQIHFRNLDFHNFIISFRLRLHTVTITIKHVNKSQFLKRRRGGQLEATAVLVDQDELQLVICVWGCTVLIWNPCSRLGGALYTHEAEQALAVLY